jgi:AraC family transcriptional regulator
MEIRSLCYTRPATDVQTFHDDSCFLSYTLEPRPGNARGAFREVWTDGRSEQCGDIVFVPKGIRLVAACDAGHQRYLALNLAADLFSVEWPALGDRALVESLSLECPDVKRGLRRLVWELVNPSLTSPIAIDALSTMLAVDIERRLQGLNQENGRKIGGLSPVRLRRIEARIHSDLPIPALTELADHCGLSLRHLARAFREETGRTIGEYVNTAAREKAYRLLRSGELTIGAIARQVGFSSAASFSYAFRRDTGTKPSDVRKTRRYH